MGNIHKQKLNRNVVLKICIYLLKRHVKELTVSPVFRPITTVTNDKAGFSHRNE